MVTRTKIADEKLEHMRRELQRLSKLDVETLLKEQGSQHLCRHCNQPKTPVRKTLDYNGRHFEWWSWPDRHGCQAEIEHIVDEQKLAEEAEHRRRVEDYQNRLQAAGLTGLLAKYTFENFCVRQDWQEANIIKYRVMRYAETILAGRIERPFLVLHGKYGAGKSHLAGAVLRHAIDAGWRKCYFRVWTRYLSRLQASWKGADDEFGAETEADIVNELVSGRLVVIDDLDKRMPSEWTRGVLFDVINTRYNAQLPTIITLNYGLSDVDEKAPGRLVLTPYIGQAVLERIIEHAFDVIEFDGPSYRLA